MLSVTKAIGEKSQFELAELNANSKNIMKNVERFLRTLNKPQYLAELVKHSPDLELTAPIEDGVVWFRYTHTGVQGEDLDGVNRMILYELWRNHQPLSDGVKHGVYSLKAFDLTQDYVGLDMLVEQIRCTGKNLVPEYL